MGGWGGSCISLVRKNPHIHAKKWYRWYWHHFEKSILDFVKYSYIFVTFIYISYINTLAWVGMIWRIFHNSSRRHLGLGHVFQEPLDSWNHCGLAQSAFVGLFSKETAPAFSSPSWRSVPLLGVQFPSFRSGSFIVTKLVPSALRLPKSGISQLP